MESKEEQQKKTGWKITTAIEPASVFYPAEEYHQKYLSKHKKIGIC
jgi:peptide methionine sulfoxide reductase MsrA